MDITIEEAIKILSKYDNEHYRPKTRMAHKMAIEALMEQKNKLSIKENKDDGLFVTNNTRK